jgi:hypothetical protein
MSAPHFGVTGIGGRSVSFWREAMVVDRALRGLELEWPPERCRDPCSDIGRVRVDNGEEKR